MLDQADGSISFRFQGRDLHLVLGPASEGKPVRFRVTLEERRRVPTTGWTPMPRVTAP